MRSPLRTISNCCQWTKRTTTSIAVAFEDKCTSAFFCISVKLLDTKACPGGSVERILLQCRSLGFSPGSERSPGEGSGNPLQYSCLEDPMDRGAWQAVVHGKESDLT